MKIKLIAIVAILAALFAVGIRAVHPQDGLAIALGSAKSSIVVYKHGSDFSVGQKIVVNVAGQGLQTGIIKSATKETVDVDTRVAFVRVKQEDVVGKLLAVIPFFGSILGVVGL